MTDENSGAAFELPPELAKALAEHVQARHDQLEMRVELSRSRVVGFLEGLDVEQLLVLRKILNMDPESVMNNFNDGIIFGLLRWKHHVHTGTGEPDPPS